MRLSPLLIRCTMIFMLTLLLEPAGFMGGNARAAAPARAERAVDPGAMEAVDEYLYALARGDKETLKRLTPQRPENFYGPCLFKKMPTLSAARAKGHRGLIDFEGEPTDAELPAQGTIALTMRDSRQFDRWQVRGIFWKGASSLSLNPFNYSPTEQDRIQEVQVQACAEKYLRAWLEEDWETMSHMTYDWLNRKKPMKGSFYIRSLDLKPALLSDGSVRVEFRARISLRLPLLSLIRRTARGTLFAVEEEGQWKVRQMTAAL
ncbi:MAG: hypothetical protein GTO55_08500 [Armatimonadetes bacterium]|nr:hypothetical protein [Armatimonadota bacterium]NIO75836.1 hypothetical protein [Armatimonadota bacterium]